MYVCTQLVNVDALDVHQKSTHHGSDGAWWIYTHNATPSTMHYPCGALLISCFCHVCAQPRTPVLAVAAGPYVYIYRHLKPYFKVRPPSLETLLL